MVALCPEIDLGIQGDTFEESCFMLKEALEEWLKYCIKECTLEDVLKECMFFHDKLEDFKSDLQHNI